MSNATISVVCYKYKTLSNGENPLMLRISKDGKNSYTKKVLTNIGSRSRFALEMATRLKIPTKTSRTGLENLKEIIISDSNDAFSIKGFYEISGSYEFPHVEIKPAFYNNDLSYFYVGRPLIDIRSWEDNGEKFIINGREGIGKIETLEINGGCHEVPFFLSKY